MNPTSETKKSSGRGCFLYGCLSVIILFILAIVVLVMGVRYFVNSNLAKFTEATPRQFESAALPAEEGKALQERLQGFARALEQTNEPAQLTLDSRDLNAAIANEPSLVDMKNSVRVALEGDQVQGLVSIPLDKLAELPMVGWFLGGAKGRFLNATASIRVSLTNGALHTKLMDLQVKGNSVPPVALAEIEKNLPWEELQKDPKLKALLDKIDWLKIADGKVQLGTGKATAP